MASLTQSSPSTFTSASFCCQVQQPRLGGPLCGMEAIGSVIELRFAFFSPSPWPALGTRISQSFHKCTELERGWKAGKCQEFFSQEAEGCLASVPPTQLPQQKGRAAWDRGRWGERVSGLLSPFTFSPWGPAPCCTCWVACADFQAELLPCS